MPQLVDRQHLTDGQRQNAQQQALDQRVFKHAAHNAPAIDFAFGVAVVDAQKDHAHGIVHDHRRGLQRCEHGCRCAAADGRSQGNADDCTVGAHPGLRDHADALVLIGADMAHNKAQHTQQQKRDHHKNRNRNRDIVDAIQIVDIQKLHGANAVVKSKLVGLLGK